MSQTDILSTRVNLDHGLGNEQEKEIENISNRHIYIIMTKKVTLIRYDERHSDIVTNKEDTNILLL